MISHSNGTTLVRFESSKEINREAVLKRLEKLHTLALDDIENVYQVITASIENHKSWAIDLYFKYCLPLNVIHVDENDSKHDLVKKILGQKKLSFDETLKLLNTMTKIQEVENAAKHQESIVDLLTDEELKNLYSIIESRHGKLKN